MVILYLYNILLLFILFLRDNIFLLVIMSILHGGISKNLDAFSLAMQGWKLLSNYDDLITWLYKSKYSSLTSDFLEVQYLECSKVWLLVVRWWYTTFELESSVCIFEGVSFDMSWCEGVEYGQSHLPLYVINRWWIKLLVCFFLVWSVRIGWFWNLLLLAIT